MRLSDVERGDTLLYRILIPFISFVSGMRLPDAARAVFYHAEFFGNPMSAWTHAAMRGESEWNVGERELIAAMTAQWNSCSFCIGAHGAIAARVLGRPVVDSSFHDMASADLSPKMKAVLPFLEKLTKTPSQLTQDDAKQVLAKGVSAQALEDAIAACVLFDVTTHCADVLRYQMLSEPEFDKAAKQLLKQGYAFGKGKTPPHPDHRLMAEVVRRAVLEGPGITDVDLRQALASRAAGGPSIDEPYETLAKQIQEAAYKVTDEQVAAVLKRAGSQKAAYELIIAMIVGAGFAKWDRAMKVI
jgi:uncharacterized peroxidase-related enzyme